jgi:hypothetical protein
MRSPITTTTWFGVAGASVPSIAYTNVKAIDVG